MKNDINEFLWAVVEVRSGIPVSVKVFSEYKLAEEYSEKIRRNMNLDDDETGIFPINFEEVMFMETEAGVLIKPAEVLVSQALDKIGESLRADGITPEKWNKRSRDIRKQLLEEMYGLKAEA